MHWLHPTLVFAPTTWAATLAGFTALSSSGSQIEQDSDCQLPPSFAIQDFRGRSNDTGSTLSCFNFTFSDETTKLTTLCQYNSSSVSTTPGGMQERYACNDGETKFIWENKEDQLWMIERVCFTESAGAKYETAGSVLIHLNCDRDSHLCTSNATETSAKFTSISPIRDPTLRGVGRRMVVKG